MAWLLLLAAGLLESVWAIFLKQSEGFTRPWPIVGFTLAAAGSLFLLARALETLPLGTAYAVWTGIGAVSTAVLGVAFLGESTTLGRVLSIALIVVGVFGLKAFAR